MKINKRGHGYQVDWYEPVHPKRRLRQNLKVKSEQQAIHICSYLIKQYEEGNVNPFIPNFKVLEWYRNGSIKASSILEEVVEAFLKEKAQNHSIRTVEAYKEILVPFMNKTQTWNHLPTDITPEIIKSYVFRNNQLKTKTIDTYIRHIKAFFEWCVENKYVKQNPCASIKPPRIKETKLQKMTNYTEIIKVLAAADEYSARVKRHKGYDADWAKIVIALMVYTGMRRSEAITRKVKHIQGKFITVEAMKGDRERIIPIIPELAALLDPWMERIGKNAESWLFPSPVRPMQHITGERLTRVFMDIREIAEIPKSRTIHGLRHCFITEMLQRGLSTAEVKVLAGHSSVMVTEQYAHLAVDQIARKMMGG